MNEARLIVLLFILATACSPVYTPNSLNAPLFSSSGESLIGLRVGSGGGDLSGAIAIADNVGLMSSLSFSEFNRSDSGYHKHIFGEVGLGYFEYIGPRARFELYGGYGKGVSESYDHYEFIGPGKNLTKGRFNRFFLQANVGAVSENVDYAGILRVSYVNFIEFESEYAIYRQGLSDFFAEPAIMIRAGGEKIKLSAQVGLSVPVNGNPGFDYAPFLVNAGIILNLNRNIRAFHYRRF